MVTSRLCHYVVLAEHGLECCQLFRVNYYRCRVSGINRFVPQFVALPLRYRVIDTDVKLMCLA